MDWRDVAKVVAPLAPTLGSILGGFIPIPGGSLIGQTLGGMIARQFGVPATPEAVSDAIRKSDNEVAMAKLQAAVDQAKAEIDGFARVYEAETQRIIASLTAVNATMRAESERPHWFFTGWRSAGGWVLITFAIAFGVLLTLATVQALSGRPDSLKVIAEAWPTFLLYFAALAAIVGVYFPSTTDRTVPRK